MLRRVNQTIERQGLLHRGDACIIALSGGADSAALLSCLQRLSAGYGLRLRAVHVHHGLRGGEADRDAAFSRDLARGMGVEFVLVSRDVSAFAREEKLSLEEAARILRYQALEEEALRLDKEGRITKIAVAHNQEDNAETILMQLLRGSGLQGLSGIPQRRGRIIRPLLEIGRKEIEDYLREQRIGFIVDSSNLEERFTRNRIRHRILPLLCSEINPAAVEHINAAGRCIARANEYIRGEAERICEEFGIETEDAVSLRLEAFSAKRASIGSELIRRMLMKLHPQMKDIGAVHIGDIEALVDAETGKRLDLPCGLCAQKDYGQLRIYRRKAATEREEPGGRFIFREFLYRREESIPAGAWCKWFDADALGGDYQIRCRKSGDYIELRGVGKKSIKAYMRDAKLPAAKRDKMLLLAKESHIVWIPGMRISEAFKIRETTRRVLEVKYTENDEEEKGS